MSGTGSLRRSSAAALSDGASGGGSGGTAPGGGFAPSSKQSHPPTKKQKVSIGANKMPRKKEDDEETLVGDGDLDPVADPGHGDARWMIGNHFGNPSELWFRDCKPDFNHELEDQFDTGENERLFNWTRGRQPKTFLHDLVHMTQTNQATGEVKLLRRVCVLQSSYRERPDE